MDEYKKAQERLSAMGVDVPSLIDNKRPWRSVYDRLLDLREKLNDPEEEEDAGKIKKFIAGTEAELLNLYHDKIAELYPYLLFEEGEDKTYWLYDDDTGVYKEMNISVARSLVMREVMRDGITATTAFARECLARYRAQYPERGHVYSDFDATQGLLHVANGWVDVHTRKLSKHTPERLSTVKSDVVFDSSATCPTYDSLFDQWEMTPDQVEVIDQFSGNTLVPNADAARMLVLEGMPGTGKSILANVWCSVLGDLAVREFSLDAFTNNPRFCNTSFVGKQLVWFNESDPKRTQMGTELQKLIDGHTFNVERKGVSDSTEHVNMCSCVLTTNDLPSTMGDGMESRILYIQYTKVFRNTEEEDPNLYKKLDAERSGILNRMLRGLQHYTKKGRYSIVLNQEDIMAEHRLTRSLPIEFLDVHFDPCDDLAGESFISNMEFRRAFANYADKMPGYFNSPERISKELYKNMPKAFHGKLRKHRLINGVRGMVGLRIKDAYRWENDHDRRLIVSRSPDHLQDIIDNF